MSGTIWWAALLVLAFIYVYAHYAFATITAHVSAFYVAFLLVIIAAGTPPYLAPGSAIESRRPQRASCTFTHRGGVEAYCAAAARTLAPDGVFVVCEQADRDARVHAAAATHDLAVATTLPVVPRAGKSALFAVHVMRHARAVVRHDTLDPLVVRHADGARTAAYLRVRTEMGLPA